MLYVAARSMRYLQALRGPSGEGLHFWRLGSFEGPDGTMLDVYQVEHDGTVHHLYVDGYRSAELRAPRGLVCGSLQIESMRCYAACFVQFSSFAKRPFARARSGPSMKVRENGPYTRAGLKMTVERPPRRPISWTTRSAAALLSP